MKNLRSVFKSRINSIHFVGIGGLGMSGIAEVLHNMGYFISGSDTCSSQITERLEKIGCKIFYQHNKNNISNAQAVVVSSAIDNHNPEVMRARQLNIAVVPRAEMLSELMRFRFGITIAGTHGKTTTTSIITHILNEAKFDPTYIIGGILNSSGINAKLGESDYLIAEADESDASFLHLQPMLTVITNIDQDHMSTYGNNYQNLKNAFIRFATNLPFYGACVMCTDDEGVNDILANIHRPLISYGFNDRADIQATNIKQTGMKMYFDVINHKDNKTFPIKLNLVGKHNVLNTLAAIGICSELGIKTKTIQRSMSNFSGVARRLEYHGNLNIKNHHTPLFDDYGHHPKEIKAVFDSIKNSVENKRLIVIFQPHRYSRTQDLFDDFVHILSHADVLILLNIYSANEPPIANISSTALAKAISRHSKLKPIVIDDISKVLSALPDIINDDDILLTLGAGNIHSLPSLLKSHYQ